MSYLYVLATWLVVGLAIRAASARDQRQVWRPWAAACGLALALACVVALSACPPWERPACGSPRSYQCVNNQPHVCSPSGRLSPIGDEPCPSGTACSIGDAGIAHCMAGGAP